MASIELNPVARKDWIFANPWAWMGLGAVFTVWSWLWTLTTGVESTDHRIVVLAVGLFFTGVGVWLRWNDRQTLYLLPISAQLARVGGLAMGLVFLLVALGSTALFLM